MPRGQMREISSRVKRLVNASLARADLRLVRVREQNSNISRLHAALYGLLSVQDCINIIQVGSNDGKLNDPLYGFVIENYEHTRLLLCEPQPEIAAMLVQTYPGHPRIHIFTGAVGDQKGSLGLFRVKPEMWDAVEMPYLGDASAYRAPSGFASTDRGHVERHVKMMRDRKSGQPVLFDDSIELLQVPAETIQSLLAMHPALTHVDVLQVDIEGMDDLLVINAVSEHFLPRVVNFEVAHLSVERLTAVVAHLEGLGYFTIREGQDLLAMHRPRHVKAPAKQ